MYPGVDRAACQLEECAGRFEGREEALRARRMPVIWRSTIAGMEWFTVLHRAIPNRIHHRSVTGNKGYFMNSPPYDSPDLSTTP